MIRTTLALALSMTLTLPALAQEGSGSAEETPNWAKIITGQLKSKKITLDFTDTPMLDVVMFLKQVTQLNMVVDPASKLAGEKVNLAVRDVTVENALKLMLGLKGCEYQLRSGALVIGKKGKAAAYPKRAPARPAGEGADPAHFKTWEKFQRKVTVDFSGTPIDDVVQFLRETSGVTIDLAEKLKGRKVDFAVQQVTCAQALTLIAHGIGGRLQFADGKWRVALREAKEGGAPDGEGSDDGEEKKGD